MPGRRVVSSESPQRHELQQPRVDLPPREDGDGPPAGVNQSQASILGGEAAAGINLHTHNGRRSHAEGNADAPGRNPRAGSGSRGRTVEQRQRHIR
jgi:hypothetical protein